MIGYNDKLASGDQVGAEEWIAGEIFDSTNAREELASDLGRSILLEVLRRFRPDLVDE